MVAALDVGHGGVVAAGDGLQGIAAAHGVGHGLLAAVSAIAIVAGVVVTLVASFVAAVRFVVSMAVVSLLIAAGAHMQYLAGADVVAAQVVSTAEVGHVYVVAAGNGIQRFAGLHFMGDGLRTTAVGLLLLAGSAALVVAGVGGQLAEAGIVGAASFSLGLAAGFLGFSLGSGGAHGGCGAITIIGFIGIDRCGVVIRAAAIGQGHQWVGLKVAVVSKLGSFR